MWTNAKAKFYMQKTITLIVGFSLSFYLSACSLRGNSVDLESENSASASNKFVWPHKKPLSAREQESFNIDFTSLDGTFKSGQERSGKYGKEFVIKINENDVEFIIGYQSYPKFQKDEFDKKAKQGTPIKFLVEHLEAEQPHADKETGVLSMSLYGVIVANDNIDLIKSQD